MKKNKLLFRSTIGVVILVIGGFIVAYTTDDKFVNGDNLVLKKFQVISPAVTDTAYSIDYVADIQAIQHIELRARVKGFIEKIHVDEGQTVKKGDILFSISRQEYQADLLKATAALNNVIAEMKAAEVEWKSTKELVDKNIVADTQLELAQAKADALAARVDEAKSHQEAARINLSYANVTAPFNGIVGRLPNKAGSFVEESALLTTISNNAIVYAYFNVSESEYLDLLDARDNTAHRPVSLVLSNDRLYPLKGNIETTSNSINKETGSISFRASFSNPDLLLKHGATGKVKIDKQLKNVLIIPQVATVEAQDKIFVYVVDSDNVVSRKNITPILRLRNIYVLGSESGLAASDRIIYKGIQMIRDGDKVDPDLTTFLPVPREIKLASLAH